MKTQIFKLFPISIFFSFCLLCGFVSKNASQKYKCLIQMKKYSGEGAYIVLSLINPKGDYEKTLYVHGKDSKWYYEIDKWWSFYGKRRSNIDAISGATLSGEEREVNVIQIDTNKINKGYKVRFETSVENQEYYASDIEFELTTENLSGKYKGKGFIEYIRIRPQ